MSRWRYSIVHTSEERLPLAIYETCMESVLRISMGPVYDIRQRNGVRRGIRAMYVNVLAGLHQCEEGTVYICEHDVLYPDGYFDWRAGKGEITYAKYALFLLPDGWALRNTYALSSCAGDRDALIAAIEAKLVEHCKRGKVARVEPAPTGYRDDGCQTVDIRHGQNYTGERNAECFPDHEYWGNAAEWWRKLKGEGQ